MILLVILVVVFLLVCLTYLTITSVIKSKYKKFLLKNSISLKKLFELNKKYGFPLSMTESEMARELKCSRVYDCGLIKYVWEKFGC